MADFKCHPMLLVTLEQLKSIRENVSLTNLDNLDEAVNHVMEWFAKEKHLPDMELDRKVIENMYISRKCSLEQTKKKLDMLFAMKSLLPDYVTPRDPFSTKVKRAFEIHNVVPLPKLAPDNTRIMVLQHRQNDPDKYALVDLAIIANMILEYRLHHDCAAGIRVITDYHNTTLPIMLKWTPTFLKNLETFTACYGCRFKGIHFVNAPWFVGRIISLFKGAVKPKLFNRIVIHDSLEDLYTALPKEILPKDYGGNEPSVNDISDEWYKEFCKPDNRQFLIDSENWKSDESKRIGSSINTGEFGIDGTFRKLDIF